MFETNREISPKITALTFGVLVATFLIAFYAVAVWQDPVQAPPEGNVAAPLNIGSDVQIKEGPLVVNNEGFVTGLVIQNGELCLGSDCITSWPVGGGGIPAFYKRESSGGLATSRTVYCNCGDVVTGGGGQWKETIIGPGSKPLTGGNGWLCNGTGWAGVGQVQECYAMCANTTIDSEGCDNCWEGSNNYTLAPDTYDQNCNGTKDEYTGPYSKTCDVDGIPYSSALEKYLLSACRTAAPNALAECTVTCTPGWADATRGFDFESCNFNDVGGSYTGGDLWCDMSQPVTCDCPGYYQ